MIKNNQKNIFKNKNFEKKKKKRKIAYAIFPTITISLF